MNNFTNHHESINKLKREKVEKIRKFFIGIGVTALAGAAVLGGGSSFFNNVAKSQPTNTQPKLENVAKQQNQTPSLGAEENTEKKAEQQAEQKTSSVESSKEKQASPEEIKQAEMDAKNKILNDYMKNVGVMDLSMGSYSVKDLEARGVKDLPVNFETPQRAQEVKDLADKFLKQEIKGNGFKLISEIIPANPESANKNTLSIPSIGIENLPLVTDMALSEMYTEGENGELKVENNQPVNAKNVLTPICKLSPAYLNICDAFNKRTLQGAVQMPFSTNLGDEHAVVASHVGNWNFDLPVYNDYKSDPNVVATKKSPYAEAFKPLEKGLAGGEKVTAIDSEGRKLIYKVFASEVLDENDSNNTYKNFYKVDGKIVSGEEGKLAYDQAKQNGQEASEVRVLTTITCITTIVKGNYTFPTRMVVRSELDMLETLKANPNVSSDVLSQNIK